MLNKFILTIIFLLLLCGRGWATTVTFQQGVSPTAEYAGTADGRIYQFAPTTNYSTETTLTLYGVTNYINSSLIKFDLSSISSSATISSATLYLYRNYVANSDTGTISLFRIFKPWAVSTTTWNSWDTGMEWGTAGCENASDAGSDNSSDGSGYDRKATAEGTFLIEGYSYGEVSIDITTAVSNWVSGTWNNNGLLLKVTTGTLSNAGRTVSSSENATADDRPYLVVEYTEGASSTRRIMVIDE